LSDPMFIDAISGFAHLAGPGADQASSQSAAGGDVDDGISFGLDGRQE